MILKTIAGSILGVNSSETETLIELRKGARTIGLFATSPEQSHLFDSQAKQVLVKLYKGDGRTEGSRQYQTYHATHFQEIAALQENRFIQKSLAAGIFRGVDGMYPYAVLEYILGTELAVLLAKGHIDFPVACGFLEKILLEIWIPLWDAGLRFKDCHPGNFVVTESSGVHMIDTEQIRKDAAELIQTPDNWKQRNRHEELGLQRLPGLITRLILGAKPHLRESTTDREIRILLACTELPEKLKNLGRKGPPDSAIQSALRLVEEIRAFD